MVFITRSPDSFHRARAERLKVSGNPAQYDDLQRFIDEQEQFKAHISKSVLPVLNLDISDGDISKATDKIADWLESTGGLHASS